MTTVTPAPATATDLEQRGFAVSSLVLGLVSFVAGFTFVVPVAGLVLGLVESLGTVYIGGEWKDVFAFGILILILVLKPTGLLGEKVTERM